jgi:antitoxin component YwqK of YwqJK toxin-antitoxin module
MKPIVLLAILAIASMSYAASPDGFKCLDGAKDSGPYIPGNVVRWCEITKDGRLLYHGSVWRWYQNGQMEGKESYVYGNAEGEWPSWYENGKPSSLGTFKNGSKIGLWKYWDEAGWLKTEVTYTEIGNLWTQYYPTGKKKAAGKTVQSGKIGKWTYWDSNGREKARCDFGDGLFAISSKPCQIIADELEPKGFSQPIPVATSAPDSSAVIKVASQIYKFSVPHGWVADTKTGKEQEAPLFFYPVGGSWRGTGPNIYIRVLYKNGATFESIVKNESENFEQNVAEYTEKATNLDKQQNGTTTLTKTITYKPLIQTDSPFSIVSDNIIYETISFINTSDQLTFMTVLTCHSESQLKESTAALLKIVSSFHTQSGL